MSKYNIAQM